MKKYLSRRKLISAGAVASLVAIPWYLLDSGFCFSQMRYLSDRELIVEAIRYNKHEMKIDGNDESIDRFLKQNPNCCYVDRQPSSREFMGFIGVCLGFNYLEVTLNYEQKNPRSAGEPYYERYVSINACGKNPNSEYGISHPVLRKFN